MADGMPDARWWRGNLHMHSLWSDGDGFPEMAADRYKDLGYHFVAITDHDALQEGERRVPPDAKPNTIGRVADYIARFGETWVEQNDDGVRLKPFEEYRSRVDEDGRFIVMTGEEVTVRVPESRHYMNAWNLAEAVAPPTEDDAVRGMEHVVRAVEAQAAATGRHIGLHLNHPNWQWCAVAEDIARVRGLRFMEIFTALQECHSHGDALRASPERIWDVVLALRLGELGLPPIYGLAADDAHAYDDPGQAAGRAWVNVRAHTLTSDAIVAAMQAGDFHASTGVALDDVSCEGGELTVAIAAEPGVSYRTEFIGTRRDFDRHSEPRVDEDGRELRTTRRYSGDVGAVLQEADGVCAAYAFEGDELYVRARITSDKPLPNPHEPGDVQMAWTQPVTLGA